MKYITDDKEHHQILFELGILDDEEDWPMFQLQEERYDIDADIWLKYVSKEKCGYGGIGRHTA